MRIGLVLDDALDSPDGVQQYVLRVADWMRAHGHEVHFIVGDTKRQDLENLYSIGRNVSVEFNGNTLSMPLPAQRSQLQALLGKLKLDVLHVQTPYSPFMGGRLIDLVDDSVAVVGTFHILPYSVLSTMGSRVLGAWNGRTAKRFDAMMATSVPAQQFAERYYGLSSVVVPNGFDMETFTAGKPAHSRKQIKYLGRLVARKGPLELAKAVGLLYDRGDWPKGWQVVIAGKGNCCRSSERSFRHMVYTILFPCLGLLPRTPRQIIWRMQILPRSRVLREKALASVCSKVWPAPEASC